MKAKAVLRPVEAVHVAMLSMCGSCCHFSIGDVRTYDLHGDVAGPKSPSYMQTGCRWVDIGPHHADFQILYSAKCQQCS